MLLAGTGKPDGDLAPQDSLAVELSDGTLRLAGGGERNEGVAGGARAARVGGDGGGLAVGANISLNGHGRQQGAQGTPTQGSP
jgi:hypothetical protein